MARFSVIAGAVLAVTFFSGNSHAQTRETSEAEEKKIQRLVQTLESETIPKVEQSLKEAAGKPIRLTVATKTFAGREYLFERMIDRDLPLIGVVFKNVSKEEKTKTDLVQAISTIEVTYDGTLDETRYEHLKETKTLQITVSSHPWGDFISRDRLSWALYQIHRDIRKSVLLAVPTEKLPKNEWAAHAKALLKGREEGALREEEIVPRFLWMNEHQPPSETGKIVNPYLLDYCRRYSPFSSSGKEAERMNPWLTARLNQGDDKEKLEILRLFSTWHRSDRAKSLNIPDLALKQLETTTNREIRKYVLNFLEPDPEGKLRFSGDEWFYEACKESSGCLQKLIGRHLQQGNPKEIPSVIANLLNVRPPNSVTLLLSAWKNLEKDSLRWEAVAQGVRFSLGYQRFDEKEFGEPLFSYLWNVWSSSPPRRGIAFVLMNAAHNDDFKQRWEIDPLEKRVYLDDASIQAALSLQPDIAEELVDRRWAMVSDQARQGIAQSLGQSLLDQLNTGDERYLYRTKSALISLARRLGETKDFKGLDALDQKLTAQLNQHPGKVRDYESILAEVRSQKKNLPIVRPSVEKSISHGTSSIVETLKNGTEREKIDLLKFREDELLPLWTEIFPILVALYEKDSSEEVQVLAGQFLNWRALFGNHHEHGEYEKLMAVNRRLLVHAETKVRQIALQGIERIGGELYSDSEKVPALAPIFLEVATNPKLDLETRKKAISELFDLPGMEPNKWLQALPFYEKVLGQWKGLTRDLRYEATQQALTQGILIREKSRTAALFSRALDLSPPQSKEELLASVHLWLGFSYSLDPSVRDPQDLAPYYQVLVTPEEEILRQISEKYLPSVIERVKGDEERKLGNAVLAKLHFFLTR